MTTKVELIPVSEGNRITVEKDEKVIVGRGSSLGVSCCVWSRCPPLDDLRSSATRRKSLVIMQNCSSKTITLFGSSQRIPILSFIVRWTGKSFNCQKMPNVNWKKAIKSVCCRRVFSFASASPLRWTIITNQIRSRIPNGRKWLIHHQFVRHRRMRGHRRMALAIRLAIRKHPSLNLTMRSNWRKQLRQRNVLQSRRKSFRTWRNPNRLVQLLRLLLPQDDLVSLRIAYRLCEIELVPVRSIVSSLLIRSVLGRKRIWNDRWEDAQTSKVDVSTDTIASGQTDDDNTQIVSITKAFVDSCVGYLKTTP